ncbi:hypothetical protein SK128_019133, partial [Halocaridina rubra]
MTKSDGDIMDAGGFGKTGEDLEYRYARMPVERDSSYYNMNHKYRGRCIIFNHRIFDTHTGLG